MKKICMILLISLLVLPLSVPLYVRASDLPLISSGYTEDGIYYEVYGEQPVQNGTTIYVSRPIIYSGRVTPPQQKEWSEKINEVQWIGTLQLSQFMYDKKANQTTATYEGYLYAQ